MVSIKIFFELILASDIFSKYAGVRSFCGNTFIHLNLEFKCTCQSEGAHISEGPIKNALQQY
jgi:hypothetical protein